MKTRATVFDDVDANESYTGILLTGSNSHMRCLILMLVSEMLMGLYMHLSVGISCKDTTTVSTTSLTAATLRVVNTPGSLAYKLSNNCGCR